MPRLPAIRHAPSVSAASAASVTPTAPRPGALALATPAVPPAPPGLDGEAQEALLNVARAALRYAVGAASSPELEAVIDVAREIGEPAAAFVTLTEYGDLRGCMGDLDRMSPLAETVAGAAVTVAGHDPRFLPVSRGELPSIHVEISVLGESVPLPDAAAFRPGIDGVIVSRRGRRALLLPDVATDQGWGTREMLDAVCQKAGLPRDAWRDAWTDGETELLRFCSLRFGGPAIPMPARDAALSGRTAQPPSPEQGGRRHRR